MADLPNADYLNPDKVVTIQTHDRRFHVDDVGAVSLLTCYFNSKNVKIHLIRSRDSELLESSNILVDVGGIYSPETGRFDHHQENCNETYSSKSAIPMSSIGMVWKHYGKEILNLYLDANNLTQMKDYVDELCQEVYSKIIQEIDAHDNGILMVEGGKRNYRLNMDIASIISSLNGDDTSDEMNQMEAFGEAVSLFGKIFEIRLKDVIRKFYSYTVNQDKIRKLLSENPFEGCNYLVINEKIDSIYKLLNALDPSFKIKFLIFTDIPNEVTIKTRSKPDNVYCPLVPLLSEEKLRKELEDDLIFVHKALFMAKTKTLDSAIKAVDVSSNVKTDEEIPQSYLNVIKPRNSWLKLGGIGMVVLTGILLYRKHSE